MSSHSLLGEKSWSRNIPFSSGDIVAARHVTIAAVGLDKVVTYVHGVDEILDLGPRRDVLLFLTDYGMTEVAILGDDSAVPALMLSVVAAETAGEIEVADIIGISIP